MQIVQESNRKTEKFLFIATVVLVVQLSAKNFLLRISPIFQKSCSGEILDAVRTRKALYF